MSTRRFTTAAFVGALLAAVALVPVTGYADSGSRTAVTIGYRDYDGGGHHYRPHHRHYYRHHAPYGRAYGYYGPVYYPAPIYYRPYYPTYYPAPSYYYGPGGNWSIDLHYFFSD